MTESSKFLLMMMFAIWGVGLAMTVNGPDKGGTQTEEGGHKEGRGLFAPRVEYDEWTPLGHGDPLKNDPTYDYVPPVLERVRYWIEPASSKKQTTSGSAQRPVKRPPRPEHQRPATSAYGEEGVIPTDRRDNHPFLTMVDGPKFNLPPSPPYKPSAPSRPQHYTRPPYRPPPPRPTYTTPAPTTDTTTSPPTTTTFQTTTTPPSPVFLTSASPYYHTSPPPRPTTRAPPTSYTTSASLTTDPLFAHYKQPSKPLQGPMYLIIEGHSKVKTYGANNPANPNAVSESSRRQRRRRRKRRLISSFLKSFL